MSPTIRVQDRVLVVKDDITNLSYEIGDIVVFYNPLTHSQITYLDRLIDSFKIGPFNQNEEASDLSLIHI